jgi:hypothetical protein
LDGMIAGPCCDLSVSHLFFYSFGPDPCLSAFIRVPSGLVSLSL